MRCLWLYEAMPLNKRSGASYQGNQYTVIIEVTS